APVSVMSGFIKLLNRGRPALSVLAGLLLAGIWHVANTGSPTGAGMPEGRYHSAGQLQMSDGTVLEVNHSIRFNGGRFYAISRQGDILQDSSGLVERAGGALLLDRKSTRLNSSHVKISYAVFCLTKKN